MDINATNMRELVRAYNTAWQAGIAIRPAADLGFLFRDFPSTTKSNAYAWLDRFPGFREWVGDRVFNDVMSQKFVVDNRDFEASVSVGRNDIEDDQYGIYAPMVQMMAEGWVVAKHSWVVDVLTGQPLTFTGKAMCATDHKYGKNTISNKATGALTATTFAASFTAASAWKFASGELCRTRFTHLVHGPALHETAFNIVDAPQISDAANNLVSNPNYKRCERVELPELAGTYANYWFLVDGSQPVRAISRQIRREALPLMDERPEQVMRTGKLDVMADGRGAAAPTFPHLVYGGIVAA
jgi:phage major head subunit gpT-like protein